MNLSIVVKVSEAEAIKRGELVAGMVRVSIPSWEGWTEEERVALADALEQQSGEPPQLAPYRGGVVPTPEGVHEWARRQAGENARRAAEKAADLAEKKAKMLADPAGSAHDCRVPGNRLCPQCGEAPELLRAEWYSYMLNGLDPDDPDLVAALASFNARRAMGDEARFDTHVKQCREAKARLAENLQREEEEKARKATQAAAWEAARSAFLVAGVALTDEQAERRVAGYLPEAEADEAIRNAVFAPFKGSPYILMPKDMLDGVGDEYCSHKVRFEAEDTEELTAAQFASFRRYASLTQDLNERALPEGNPRRILYGAVARRHRAYCDRAQCDASACRWGVLVEARFPEAGKVLKREFALPSDTE